MERLTPDQAQMVADNLGLIWRHVGKRRAAGMPEDRAEDTFQDGVFGLIRAAQKFDPDRGCTFSTYAEAWIRQSMSRGAGFFEGRAFRRAVVNGTDWQRPVSLDVVYGEDGDTDLGDFLVGDDGSTWADELAVDAFIGRLTDDERQLLFAPGEYAEAHGVSTATTYNRRRALRARLAPLAELVAS